MLILHNARIYTMDPGRPMASALAMERGEIVAVGADQEILSEFDLHLRRSTPGEIKQLDIGGRVIFPGLTDAHIHLEKYALGLTKVDCETSTRQECLTRISKRVRNTPKGEWVLGHGWNQNDWVDGFGTAILLDAVSSEHPIYLTAKSLHAGWVNSLALRQANITRHTPDPVGGRIGRAIDGTPDGILYESAMELISQVVPVPTVDQVADSIHHAQSTLWKMGITGVHDFDQRRCFAALQKLHLQEVLKLRIVKSIPLDDLPHAVAVGLRTGFGDDMLRIGSIKAFADGALGPRTAAMLQPYNQEPENLGMLLIDAEELYEHGRIAVENGLSMAVHAIGDRANHEVLNAYENLRAYEKSLNRADPSNSISMSKFRSPLRHRIEHVQIIHPDDAGRLGQLEVIASMQPSHAPSDMPSAERYWSERSAFAYAWRTQLDHGARLAFGSDAPVESPNPFWGLHAAVTRRRADGKPGQAGWIPKERISLLDALCAYTTGPAFAGYQENRLGKLAPGYLSDLIVLNEDPFTCQPDEIREISPSATMVAGEWVFIEDGSSLIA